MSEIITMENKQLNGHNNGHTSISIEHGEVHHEPKAKGSFLLKRTNELSEAAVVKKKLQGLPMESSIKPEEMGLNERVGRELIELRDKQLGPNVSVFYKQDGGVVVTEGKGCYMQDIEGNLYLDCANNVASVGHAHPTVVAAGTKELSRIQTNGRFLNPIQQRYLSKLLGTLPSELNTVYLVNSGSEANDLALRIARAHSTAVKPLDVICLDYAYHGHTQSLVDISPYKWAQAIDGKDYCPSSTHVVPCPDSYRGKHRGMTSETGLKYSLDIEEVLNKTGGVGTFIAESIVGCGGQIVLPPGYLPKVYELIRAKGGVCIADEVQTGFARSGNYFWMFEEYGVIPDIVTMGKPMGNGYPVAAVVCRREVANSFAATGIEYFNTYGGNSVACAIAEGVIDTIFAENLQKNSLETGEYLCQKLAPLQEKYKSIGDVRGIGLFQGIEFIHIQAPSSNPKIDEYGNILIEPNPTLTKFIVDFLRYEKVIISRDGPDENVIKIKPPLVFGKKEVDILVSAIERGMEAAKIAGFVV